MRNRAPGGGTDQILVRPIIGELIDAGVLQKAAHDTAHPDAVRQSRHAGLEGAEPAHDEIDFDPGLGGVVQGADDFRIVEPDKAIIQVANPFEATSQLAQTTLRSVLGQHELDEMLSQRDKLNADIQRILDAATDAWGIKVSTVEIKHVDLDETMIRSIAKQAEAERTRRAKIIHAEGEKQAASQLVEAARMLAAEPRALQLRYLQTLADLSSDKSTTIVFPLPLDLIRPFLDQR